jgi:hypothetical protein
MGTSGGPVSLAIKAFFGVRYAMWEERRSAQRDRQCVPTVGAAVIVEPSVNAIKALADTATRMRTGTRRSASVIIRRELAAIVTGPRLARVGYPAFLRRLAGAVTGAGLAAAGFFALPPPTGISICG